jgi:serine acetyltransferase
MREEMRLDARFHHELRRPGRRPTPLSLALLWLGSPGLWVLFWHRLGHLSATAPRPVTLGRLRSLPLRTAVLLAHYLSHVLVKCDLLPSMSIEGGVCLANRGHIVLGARTVGRGTLIHDHVTIGMSLASGALPAIGRNVWIGPHSVIYGGVTIGDGVTVLPRTVLTRSLPAAVVVGGNPARVVRGGFDNSALRRSFSAGAHIVQSEPDLLPD